MSVQRIEILGVPVDVCPKTDLEQKILSLLEKQGPSQIVFLSIWDLLKAKRNAEYAESLQKADLILPISKSILKGAKSLKKTIPVRYNPFEASISILTTLENRYKSLYLFGARKKALIAAERNVQKTFRGLRIVGRYVGYYKKEAEPGILQAIQKSSPSLVLQSEGIREKDLWFHQNREKFSTSIFMYYHDCIGIFGKRIRRINPKTFDRGTEIWGEIIRNPLKILLLIPFLWYKAMLLWVKIFKKD